jgi:release factor glutamine methyltransferase
MTEHALDLLRHCALFLKKHGIPQAEKEAELIITEGIGIDRVSLYRDNPTLSKAETEKLNEILRRRTKREPLQYIIGYVDFYGLKINVGQGVLIPRPETELLVEETLKRADRNSPIRIIDLCTGSGAIALALAKNLPMAELYGTDPSEKALKYAEENARINSIKNVTFLHGSLFEPVKDMIFDIIVSNPPYIKSGDIQSLQPEIRDWEPKDALDGGKDGLYFYREIFSQAARHLKPKGLIIVEAGEGQAEDITHIVRSFQFEPLSVIKDYAGIERIVVATKKKP